jgi:para-nitrobenzyl esterase
MILSFLYIQPIPKQVLITNFTTKYQGEEMKMTHKTIKLGWLSLFAMVLFMVAVFAWPSSALFAGQDDGAQYQGGHSKYTHSHGKGRLGTAIWTKNGLVVGTEDNSRGYQTWVWKGIPFAQPPVGELRWKAPQPTMNWGVLIADEFGSQCPQYDATGLFSGNEDCLYLNVWRPQTQQHNLPVYFWIHGGGNSIGTTNDPMYYMDKLASRANMVVVTTQYRLGPLGWFTHPSLQDGNPLNSSGNYGTLDIIQALKWVRKNIAAFGGDPNNITIAGESAGGWNVCSLIISPAAKGLFQKAISESGGFAVNSVDAGYASAQATIDEIITKYGPPAPGIALETYLRDKTAAEIFSVYIPWVGGMLNLAEFADLFTDGTVIHVDGQAALDNPKHYNQVPTILGTNKEEMKIFMAGMYGQTICNEEGEECITYDDATYQAMTLAASMDWQRTGVNEPATAMSAHKSQPGVYAYQFNYGAYNPTGFNAWPYPLNVMIGAAHGLEMAFFFGNWSYLVGSDLIFTEYNKPGQEALSEDMVTYLASFARTGKPSYPRSFHWLPRWLPWSNKDGGPKRILFDADATESIIQMSNE